MTRPGQRLFALAAGVAVTAAAGCAGGPAPASAPTPARPAPRPVLSAVPVTGAGYFDETSVAADPTRPGGVIAVWQVPATAGWSVDGGRTWRSGPLPGTGAWELSGDPSVTFGEDGEAYALFIAFDRPDDYRFLGRAAHRNGIFVSHSDDGGRIWSAPVAVIEHGDVPGIPFEDKPMMTVDRRAGSPHRGTLYVAWTEFRRSESVILFSRSANGGRAWSAPLEISDRPGSPQDTVGADEGTDVAVGPDGTIYVVWSDSTGLLLDRSVDGGRTFGPDARIGRTGEIVFEVPGVQRSNGYPSLEVDPRTGRLYVTWMDRSAGEADVWLTTSPDGGSTWSEPVRVSGDEAGSGIEHAFAWSSVDPATGMYVAGYYRGGSGAEGGPTLRYTVAWSTDGGRSFERRPWGRTFHPGGEFLGDYTGVDALGGVAYGAWTEVPDTVGAGARAAPESWPRTQIVVGRAKLEGRTDSSFAGGGPPP